MRRRDHIHRTDSRVEQVAEQVTDFLGSPRYLGLQTIVVVAWLAMNGTAFILHFDPFPFILLNLVFSTQAAYAAPLILLAQNRQATVDRRRDDHEAREVSLMFSVTWRMFRRILAIDRKQDRQLRIMRHQLKVLDQQHRTQAERLDSIDESLRRLLGEAS